MLGRLTKEIARKQDVSILSSHEKAALQIIYCNQDNPTPSKFGTKHLAPEKSIPRQAETARISKVRTGIL
jgi:hypothetical protein